ncbi:hypothetical protein EVAR_12429_1 [Eumeta japonica]|uniref:Uncharacterized protein n=1 Tax=Eumeta variegata TaxID=151549 RepID=A0A4C1TZF8_EUMVA|nr:hypothetical protein EVAR_12429_1 [Eumeta japonica]
MRASERHASLPLGHAGSLNVYTTPTGRGMSIARGKNEARLTLPFAGVHAGRSSEESRTDGRDTSLFVNDDVAGLRRTLARLPQLFPGADTASDGDVCGPSTYTFFFFYHTEAS